MENIKRISNLYLLVIAILCISLIIPLPVYADDEPVSSLGDTPIDSINLSPSDKTIYEGESFSISASWLPIDATDTDLEFISDDVSIATVTPDGTVTGIKQGNTFITVTNPDSGVFQTCNVTVNKKVLVSSVSFAGPFTTISKSEVRRLYANVLPSNASNRTLTWKSSNTKILTVDGNGNVRGIADGKAVISATSKDGTNKVAQVTITVKTIAVSKIAFAPSDVRLFSNQKTANLRINFTPYNASNKSIKYTSSNPQVISVDSSGKVTMKKPGKATITATSANGKKATCRVFGFKVTKEFAKLAPSTAMTYNELVRYDGKKYSVPKSTLKGSPTKYRIVVDVKNQITTVYTQGSSRKYDKVVRYMICSTGVLKPRTKSPIGTFKLNGQKSRFYYFRMYNVYGQFATRITGPYLFHSYTYSKKKTGALIKSGYRKMGSPASHGCIRLTVPDAKWIYDNVPKNTQVVITNSLPKNNYLKSQLRIAPVGF